MSELESLPFMGSVDEHTLKPIQPSTLFVQLADGNEWLEQKVCGFKEVVIRYHDKECHFTPEEVLRALYAVREMPDVTDDRIVRCKYCKHFTPNEEFWLEPPDVPFPMIGATCDSCDFWANTKCKVEPDGFCYRGETRDDQ